MGIIENQTRTNSLLQAPHHIPSPPLLPSQPRSQHPRRLQRPIQQQAPLRHRLKVPTSPITRNDLDHLLQQLPQQHLRVLQRRSRRAVILIENRLIGRDADKSLREGCVESVVLDECYKEVVGREGAGFRFGKFRRDGGDGGGGREGGAPDC